MNDIKLTLRDEWRHGAHEGRVFDLLNGDECMAACAAEYIRLRTATVLPLRPVVWQGITIADVTALNTVLQRLLVPGRQPEMPKNFEILRSDLGELIMYHVLESEYGAKIGHRPIRFRELAERSARGVDVIAVGTGSELEIFVGEAKVSDAVGCPPSVVDSSDDSLWKQHLKHFVVNLPGTIQKLADAMAKTSDDEVHERLAAAVMLLADGQLELVQLRAFSCLLRPSGRYEGGDFGKFRGEPESLKPAQSRFVIVTTDKNLDSTLNDFAARLKASA